MTSDITWGPEIRVDGKRPEWLDGDPKMVWPAHRNGNWLDHTLNAAFDRWAWEWIGSIRLPADHPHYATQTPATAPSGGEVGPEVVERCFAVIRAYVADSGSRMPSGKSVYAEMVELAGMLPEPVDADLIAAREAEAKASEANGFRDYAAQTRAGEHDDGPVRHRYEGIKLGRALAAGDR